MKYQIAYKKIGNEISIYKNVQLVGKFPNLSERDPNKGFQAINEHINPVLGWGWLIAAMLANLVWAMPQFSLGTAALQRLGGRRIFRRQSSRNCFIN